MKGIAITILAAILIVLASCDRGQSQQERFDEIKKGAYARNAGDPNQATREINEAMYREAKNIAPSTSSKERSAISFVGYYAKFSVAMPRLCNDLGVSLDAYSSRLDKLNASSEEAAGSIVDLHALTQRALPTATMTARQQLQRISNLQGTDLVGACRFIENKAAEMAEINQFSHLAPDMYAELTNR